jgi:hypothetical protein
VHLDDLADAQVGRRQPRQQVRAARLRIDRDPVGRILIQAGDEQRARKRLSRRPVALQTRSAR